MGKVDWTIVWTQHFHSIFSEMKTQTFVNIFVCDYKEDKKRTWISERQPILPTVPVVGRLEIKVNVPKTITIYSFKTL